MNKTNFFRNILDYFNNQSIDIRIRMMFFLEYASLIAVSIGTLGMIMLNQTVESMIPNFIMFIISFPVLLFIKIAPSFLVNVPKKHYFIRLFTFIC